MAKRPLSLMILTPSTVFVSMSKVLTPWESASGALFPLVDTEKGVCYSSRTS